jgi:hypothetical protein
MASHRVPKLLEVLANGPLSVTVIAHVLDVERGLVQGTCQSCFAAT